MATFVLVPGAWLGGWCWERVTPLLRQGGHDVHTPTLTGLGERAHLATPATDLETHIADVAGVIEHEALTDVILVGHSYAGIVIDGVADRMPDRVARLVYLDSGPLGDGAAHAEFYPPAVRDALQRQVDAYGDGWRLPFPGTAQLGMTASLAGLGDEELKLMDARATAQPFQTFVQPLHLANPAEFSYDRALILCSDGGFTVGQVRELVAAGDPHFQVFAAPDWRFYEIPTGHWPMLSAPRELADTLLEIARA